MKVLTDTGLVTFWNKIKSYVSGSIFNPDDEDISSSKNSSGAKILKLADREYNASNFSGKGYKILRKNIKTVNNVKKNVLEQSMINTANTVYEIRYDFDLNGATIEIPEGCTLAFEGGSLANGTVKGNYTSIRNSGMEYVFKTGVSVSGTWDGVTAYAEWFGAKGNGKNGDSASIQNMFNSTFSVFGFLSKEYVLDKTVTLQNNDISVLGNNSIINCKDSVSNVANVGNGSAFAIKGENITIDGLHFIARKVTPPAGDYYYGRMICIFSSNVVIKNCQFKDGNGGAIYCMGKNSNIKILKCCFTGCNNHVNGGDYGSIHISDNSSNITIESNLIEDYYYSGISCVGGDNFIISNNVIQGKSDSNKTMGIYCLDKNSKNMTISNNRIEGCAAENICIHIYPDSNTENIFIHDNVLTDANYRQISFESHDAGVPNNIVIRNNIMQQVSMNGHNIVLDYAKNCIIDGNKITGNNYEADGISILNTPESEGNNIISNNSIDKCRYAIYCVDKAKGIIKNNLITDCNFGIGVGYSMNGVVIRDNIANLIKEKVFYFNNSSPILIGNHGVGKSIGTSGVTSILSNLTTNFANINYSAIGQLDKGAKVNLTFYGITSGDVFLALPLEAGEGILYISSVDYANNLVSVKSTNSNDLRKFIIIRIANYDG